MSARRRTTAHHPTPPRRPRRRFTLNQLAAVKGVIEREHRHIAEVDPFSPRIKPTMPAVGGASALADDEPQHRGMGHT